MRNGFNSGSNLQDFLDLLLQHHGMKHFYLNCIGNISDADLLLTALRNAKLFHAVLEDHAITTAAMRAVDTSRFAGDLSGGPWSRSGATENTISPLTITATRRGWRRRNGLIRIEANRIEGTEADIDPKHLTDGHTEKNFDPVKV